MCLAYCSFYPVLRFERALTQIGHIKMSRFSIIYSEFQDPQATITGHQNWFVKNIYVISTKTCIKSSRLNNFKNLLEYHSIITSKIFQHKLNTGTVDSFFSTLNSHCLKTKQRIVMIFSELTQFMYRN
jgi:hypothetical protein